MLLSVIIYPDLFVDWKDTVIMNPEAMKAPKHDKDRHVTHQGIEVAGDIVAAVVKAFFMRRILVRK